MVIKVWADLILVLSTLYVEAGTVLKHVAAYSQLGTAAVLKIFSLGTFAAVLKIFSLGTFAVWRCPAGPSRGGMPGSAMPCYAIMPPLSRMSWMMMTMKNIINIAKISQLILFSLIGPLSLMNTWAIIYLLLRSHALQNIIAAKAWARRSWRQGWHCQLLAAASALSSSLSPLSSGMSLCLCVCSTCCVCVCVCVCESIVYQDVYNCTHLLTVLFNCLSCWWRIGRCAQQGY